MTHESVTEFWRRRFRRQRHVNAGVRSLLRKYGSASSTRGVVNDFLLTLMGNLITSEACYYQMTADQRELVPFVAFGSMPATVLPRIPSDAAFAQALADGGPPQLLNSLPRASTDAPSLAPLVQQFKLFAPLHFEDQLSGVLFLGTKVSGAAFNDNDVELIEALCAVTAAVLRYMSWRQSLGSPNEDTARMLNRCRSVAGGVADHLEHMAKTIGDLADDECSARDARQRLAMVAKRAEAMRYLVHSLRLVANEAPTLNREPEQQCDAAEAVQSAVLSQKRDGGVGLSSLGIRHELDGGPYLVPFRHDTIAGAVKEILEAMVEDHGDLRLLIVRIDRTLGLPQEVGSGDRRKPELPVLRIRLESHDATLIENRQGMKMLADNLEAFRSVNDPRPMQSLIVKGGGAIVSRRERGISAYLLYVPLASV